MSTNVNWRNVENLPPKKYYCGYCGAHTGPNRGYYPEGFRTDQRADFRVIYICTNCDSPTYFQTDLQTPGVVFGSPLKHLPTIVADAYEEARRCMSVGSFTAATLLCRKLLMNVAVSEGADPGEHFVVYVKYLDTSPPRGSLGLTESEI
jgi:hypothetical protein